jgi:hypothetical protein
MTTSLLILCWQVVIIAISLVSIAVVYIFDFQKRSSNNNSNNEDNKYYDRRNNNNVNESFPFTTTTTTTSTMYPGKNYKETEMRKIHEFLSWLNSSHKILATET